MIGKRKRDTVAVKRAQDIAHSAVTADSTRTQASDVFKSHFEATFDPLPIPSIATQGLQEGASDNADGDDLEDDLTSEATGSEWSGISEDPSSLALVEVVDHAPTPKQREEDTIDKIFHKSFMGPKPPRHEKLLSQDSKATQPKNSDDLEENMNLKHDLDLQRLLRESHLLEEKKKKTTGGAQRHKATDLRLQSLGSRASLFAQDKMPMSHRKGILAKASSKDAHRRKEARENGVILEKPSKKIPVSSSRRDRGVDVPVVGKFRGGTLQLSRKDIASIQGPRHPGSRKGRR